jgi:hypothetical protein
VNGRLCEDEVITIWLGGSYADEAPTVAVVWIKAGALMTGV